MKGFLKILLLIKNTLSVCPKQIFGKGPSLYYISLDIGVVRWFRKWQFSLTFSRTENVLKVQILWPSQNIRILRRGGTKKAKTPLRN